MLIDKKEAIKYLKEMGLDHSDEFLLRLDNVLKTYIRIMGDK